MKQEGKIFTIWGAAIFYLLPVRFFRDFSDSHFHQIRVNFWNSILFFHFLPKLHLTNKSLFRNLSFFQFFKINLFTVRKITSLFFFSFLLIKITRTRKFLAILRGRHQPKIWKMSGWENPHLVAFRLGQYFLCMCERKLLSFLHILSAPSCREKRWGSCSIVTHLQALRVPRYIKFPKNKKTAFMQPTKKNWQCVFETNNGAVYYCKLCSTWHQANFLGYQSTYPGAYF